MKPLFLSAAAAISLLTVSSLHAQDTSPAQWIDPDTGHRVIQLSTEPGSESLYFNLNPFTPDGKSMVITTSNGIALVDLQTHAVKKIIEGRVHVIMVGHKTGKIYFGQTKISDGMTNHTVCVTDPTTGDTKEILKLQRGQEVSTVNADETLLGGTFIERNDWGTNAYFDGGPNRRNDIQSQDAQREKKGTMMEERLAKHYPMELFFYNIQTGETKKIDRCTDWLGHLQFSPTDPTLMMFCHEGPWHKVDRIWTIRTDGSGLQLIHQRTMIMEIAGHEFFGNDGKTIWYDLQTPRGEDFWVAGYEIATGKRTWYHMQRDEWGVHFNVSPDGTLFSSDGGDDKMVAHASNGTWMYLFRPELIEDRSAGNVETKSLIQTGVFHSERLVNMSKHDYALEPNGMFSPDMKWLIFRSNMSGVNQVYAVELEKAKQN
ncbi:MAG TPA: oligogalacturonate lyase family protein [Verrucomicrobiae bacterium]|nr:oligogalacturonate lyase family protein [Verrucomicrobiae bacterium]